MESTTETSFPPYSSSASTTKPIKRFKSTTGGSAHDRKTVFKEAISKKALTTSHLSTYFTMRNPFFPIDKLYLISYLPTPVRERMIHSSHSKMKIKKRYASNIIFVTLFGISFTIQFFDNGTTTIGFNPSCFDTIQGCVLCLKHLLGEELPHFKVHIVHVNTTFKVDLDEFHKTIYPTGYRTVGLYFKPERTKSKKGKLTELNLIPTSYFGTERRKLACAYDGIHHGLPGYVRFEQRYQGKRYVPLREIDDLHNLSRMDLFKGFQHKTLVDDLSTLPPRLRVMGEYYQLLAQIYGAKIARDRIINIDPTHFPTDLKKILTTPKIPIDLHAEFLKQLKPFDVSPTSAELALCEAVEKAMWPSPTII